MERPLPVSVTQMHWTVSSKGIYYIEFPKAPNSPKLLKFYSFQTGKVNLVATVESAISPDNSGISVSPDGRWLLYSVMSSITSDLMLVDDFR